MSVFSKCLAGVFAAAFLGFLSACIPLGAMENEVAVEPVVTEGSEKSYVQCSTPRPEICYELYQPVCATRDTGVRCFTTPCPSTETATYSNDCKACADPSVLSFMEGGACRGSELSVDLLKELGGGA